MEAILFQYGWVLIVLVVLEGLLAADNAVVMAVMVKHLPMDQQIDQIIDAELFALAGLDAQHLQLLVHSGSRGLGQSEAVAGTVHILSVPGMPTRRWRLPVWYP